MKRTLIMYCLLLIPLIGFTQAKPLEVNNYLDQEIQIVFDIKGCNSLILDIEAGETAVFKVMPSAFYSVYIFVFCSGRKKYLLYDSSIPYYAKNQPAEGTIINVKSKLFKIPPYDIKYGKIDSTIKPEPIGCFVISN